MGLEFVFWFESAAKAELPRQAALSTQIRVKQCADLHLSFNATQAFTLFVGEASFSVKPRFSNSVDRYIDV